MSYYIRVHGPDKKQAAQETKDNFAEFVKRAAPEHRADEKIITDTAERMIGVLPELEHGQEYNIILSGDYAHDDNLDKNRITGISASIDVTITGDRQMRMAFTASSALSFSATPAQPFGNGVAGQKVQGAGGGTAFKSVEQVHALAAAGLIPPGTVVVLEDGNTVTVPPNVDEEEVETEQTSVPLVERMKRKMAGYMGGK